MSFANLLSVIPATSGILLSYVIREVAEPEDGEVVYNDFMEECVARHPLEGPRFIADRKRVHQLIRTFTQGEGSYQHIASNARHMNGRTDWLALLLAFYRGSGNTAKMMSKAEAMNRTLHYKKESTMSFEKFADKLVSFRPTFYAFHLVLPWWMLWGSSSREVWWSNQLSQE